MSTTESNQGNAGGDRAQMLANRLAKRRRHLQRWAKRNTVDCYRMYDRDIPEIPIAIERYGSCLHISFYESRDPKHAGELQEFQSSWLPVIGPTLGVDPADIFVKIRHRQRGQSQYERLEGTTRTEIVHEGPNRFLVNLSDFLDTGLFLDHRNTRSMAAKEAEGRDVLNLFAYTGAFTVCTAQAGARSSLTVDMSNIYLDWAKKNLTLNNFKGPHHRFERADVLEFLHNAKSGRDRYDLVILDPPTISRSKKMRQQLNIQDDHVQMLRDTAALVRPGGTIYFSTNFRRFKLDPSLQNDFALTELTPDSIPDDFRNRKIHRCWRVTID